MLKSRNPKNIDSQICIFLDGELDCERERGIDRVIDSGVETEIDTEREREREIERYRDIRRCEVHAIYPDVYM